MGKKEEHAKSRRRGVPLDCPISKTTRVGQSQQEGTSRPIERAVRQVRPTGSRRPSAGTKARGEGPCPYTICPSPVGIPL